jgi:peptidyl-prolyl cis-trans isomerase A (cyclophilin A)
MTFQTDMGSIPCKLYEKEAPNAVRIMVGLAIGKLPYTDPKTKQLRRSKVFDGLIFHRVIPEFMIQGGDPLGTGFGQPDAKGIPFGVEAVPGLQFNVPGRLAMANTGQPNSNGSQFFITEAPYPSLNGGYTIWGQCENVDVVKAIARVKTDRNDRPLTPVHIQHVIVERVGPAPPNAPEAMPAATPATPKPAAPKPPATKPN